MYRRIELISELKITKPELFEETRISGDRHYWKHGLMGDMNHSDIADAWIYDLRGPDRPIPWNTRFYFTEKGWDKLGRKVIAACQRHNQEYRVISIKETDAQVVWRDKHTGYEVAVQPKRKRNEKE